MNKTVFAITLLAILQTGCASVGTPIDKAQFSTLERGKTTYADVIATFGKPSSVTVMDDGEKTVAYTHAESRIKAATFIPVVGLFAGGVDATSDSVLLTFNKNDILTKKSTSTSDTSIQNH